MSRSIEGRHDGRKIIFPVTVTQPEPATDLTGVKGLALLNTGATTSGIVPRIAHDLHLAPLGKRPLGFARGEAQVERYPFRIGINPQDDAPAFPFVFEQVTGFELGGNSSFDVLIGMDILSQCGFRMDRNGHWSLSFG